MKTNIAPQYLENYPFYAKHLQDRYVNEHIFHNNKNGFFIEIGAYDGVESSNTLFFEEQLNWNGICVEPLPTAFEKLLNNRKCYCINKCVSDHDGISEFMHVNPANRVKLSHSERLSNCEKLSGLTEFYCDKHVEIIDNIISNVGGEKSIINSKCIHINKILNLAPYQIDLLSIDTEGSEMLILKNIDFSKYSISVLIVETLYQEEEFDDFLETVGYKKIDKIGYDSIYKSKK